MNPFIMKDAEKCSNDFAKDIHADEDDGFRAFQVYFGLMMAFMLIMIVVSILS